MAIDKQINQNAEAVYNAYWESYLSGDIKTMANFIGDDFKVIGSTDSELFSNKKEVVKFYSDTADQIAGKVKLRNRNVKQTSFGNLILFSEVCDAFILLDNQWSFYSKMRVTSLLKKKNSGWKFVNQHGSVPDSKTEVGEQIAFEKIQKENTELREAVKRRTVEIESKNRELEIEAALERVRTIAMSMRSREGMLDVCQTISRQMELLGVKEIRNVQTAIFYEAKGSYMNYEYYSKHDKSLVTQTVFTNNEVHLEFAQKMMRGKGEIFIKNIEKKEVLDWVEYQKTTNVFIDKYLESADSLNYYWFSLGPVALGISTYEPLNENEISLFNRFLRVFELAYLRYMDIEQAEAQTREAQIETALERVRSRSMAMHSSDEFVDASDVMVNQLKKLGIETLRIGIGIINAEDESVEIWSKSEFEGKTINKILGVVPKGTHPIFDNLVKAWTEKSSFFSSERVGDEVREYYEKLDPCLSYTKREVYNERESMTAFFFKQGSLNVISLEPLSEEDYAIMIRFAKVFGQVYQRFLDLQKAEAQAKEAQIETALEKVRAVALGLKKSDEMLNVAQSLYEQLFELGFKNIRNAIIDIKNGDDDTFTDYDYSHEMSGTITQMSYNDDPTLKGQFKKMATTTDDFFELVLEGKELEDLKAMRIKNGEDEDPRLLNIDLLTYNLYSFGNGAIGISNFGVLSAEEKSVLNRFSNVFTFAYKRYTDLVQAELQAKEARIELSLERIRAQVTAMKESAELLDIVVLMRKEFVNLGHEANYFWYMRYHEEIYEKAMTSGDGTRIGMVMTLPRHIHGDIKLLADWEKSNEPTVVYAMDAEAAVDYVHKMITLGDFKQVDPNAPTLDDIRNIGGLTFIMARTNHGEIGYSLPGVLSDPPAEDLNILIRFAGVFDLAYKRFEDLKTSEMRNREAIIELALERVRARTMAMQKSNELAQTAAHLFSQLDELEISPYRCNIAIVDDQLVNCRLWSTTNSGNVIPTGSALPLNEYPVLQEMFDGWKTQKPDHVIKLTGNDRLEWTRYISKHLPFEEYKPENINETEILNNPAYFYNLYFKQGFFTIHSKEELKEDHLMIIQRFAHVFEQTYTRFQDLENAEKQNKIIQAEIERKTEELEEARQLQLAMLPKELPSVPSLDIAVYMNTATEVGGDYYDFHVDSENNLTAIIGDATGHGMKAGTMVTITKSLFNSLASSRDILNTFRRISEVIKNMKFRQLSMCLQMVKINGLDLTISSAAMPPAFIYSREENDVEEILLSGMPLGAMLNYKYKIENRKLKRGDIVLLLSDGLPELHNKRKQMYGYEKVKNELKKAGKKSPEKIVEHFEKSARTWLNGSEQDDDITFVVIKVK